MSHIHEFPVLMENNLTQRKGPNVIFSLLIMIKIDSYLENKSWMLLSLMTTIGSYFENKLFVPLSPIKRNYPKIICTLNCKVILKTFLLLNFRPIAFCRD